MRQKKLRPLGKALVIIGIFSTFSLINVGIIYSGIIDWSEKYLPSIAVFGTLQLMAILLTAVIWFGGFYAILNRVKT